jgi:hypothetical protein
MNILFLLWSFPHTKKLFVHMLYSNCFSALASLSAASSGLVVLTGLLTHSRTFSFSRPFSHTIFFISLSDCIASLACSLGYPEHSSLMCHIQSFFLVMFFPATWIWSSLLIFQLRNIIVNKSKSLSIYSMHAIGKF